MKSALICIGIPYRGFERKGARVRIINFRVTTRLQSKSNLELAVGLSRAPAWATQVPGPLEQGPCPSSLVGGPISSHFETSSIGPRIPFSRPKMVPENAWWPQFCEETAPCGRKLALSQTASVHEF
jgi:hypothetical protein